MASCTSYGIYLLSANDTTQFPASGIRRTWQRSTYNFCEIHKSSVHIGRTVQYILWVFIKASEFWGGGMSMVLGGQVARVFVGPTVKAVDSPCSHQNARPFRVTHGTGYIMVPDFFTEEIRKISSIQFIFYSIDECACWFTGFSEMTPRWLFRETQEIWGSATMCVVCPCSIATVYQLSSVSWTGSSSPAGVDCPRTVDWRHLFQFFHSFWDCFILCGCLCRTLVWSNTNKSITHSTRKKL